MKFDHVTLLTDDLPALLRFYGKLPGVKVRPPSSAGYAEIVAGSSVFGVFDRAALSAELGASLPETSGGSVILQFLVDDVDAAAGTAEAEGLAVTSRPTDMPWGSRSAYLADPDGNLVELYRWG